MSLARSPCTNPRGPARIADPRRSTERASPSPREGDGSMFLVSPCSLGFTCWSRTPCRVVDQVPFRCRLRLRACIRRIMDLTGRNPAVSVTAARPAVHDTLSANGRTAMSRRRPVSRRCVTMDCRSKPSVARPRPASWNSTHWAARRPISSMRSWADSCSITAPWAARPTRSPTMSERIPVDSPACMPNPPCAAGSSFPVPCPRNANPMASLTGCSKNVSSPAVVGSISEAPGRK